MLKDIIVDFVMFSGIEGIIFCLLFNKVFHCKKFNLVEWLILSIGNCLISQLLPPPTIYQLSMIVWMWIILSKLNSNKSKLECLKYSVYSILFFFIVEVIYSVIIAKLFGFEALVMDLTIYEQLNLFVLIIPLRFIEFYSIKIHTIIKRRL